MLLIMDFAMYFTQIPIIALTIQYFHNAVIPDIITNSRRWITAFSARVIRTLLHAETN